MLKYLNALILGGNAYLFFYHPEFISEFFGFDINGSTVITDKAINKHIAFADCMNKYSDIHMSDDTLRNAIYECMIQASLYIMTGMKLKEYGNLGDLHGNDSSGTEDLTDVQLTRAHILNIDKSKLYTYSIKDKRFYIFDSFITSFPDIIVENYGDLLKLVSLNNKMQLWFKNCKKEFATLTTAPSWILEDSELSSVWEVEFLRVDQDYKLTRRKYKTEREDLEREYRAKINEVNEREKKYCCSLIDTNYIVLIDKITVASLPVEITVKYLGLQSEDRKAALNKELNKYKQDLLRGVTNGTIAKHELTDVLKQVQSDLLT
jgi:hypothetical protein